MKSFKNSSLYRLFNWKTEGGRGRACMLLNSVFSSIAGQLSGGLFYSGFLLAYGFDYSSISILLFIPYLTTLLNLVSPSLLERFKKRKAILAIARFASHTINILGITVLPMLFEKDAAGNIINMGKMQIAFVGIIIVANTINGLFSNGYTAWHANFLPDDMRADYFSSTSCINALLTYVTVFLLSIVADTVKNTPDYLPVLTLMRFVGYALAVIDIIFLLIPKEYEYPTTVEKPKIKHVFTLPFKNKPFLMTILIIVAVTFSANIHAGYIDAFILNEIGIPYSLTNGINALYFAFFIVFGAMWKKFIAKNTWLRALGFSLIIESFSYLLYSYIAPGRVALYVIVRLWQHVMGVVRGIIVSSLPYLNLPESDRTNYLAFYTIVNNGGAFLARFIGLMIYDHVGEVSFLGINGRVPLLIFLCAALEMVAAIPCFVWFRKATPKQLLDEYDSRREMSASRRAEKKAVREQKKAEKAKKI